MRRLARERLTERFLVIEVERLNAMKDAPKDAAAVVLREALKDAEQRGQGGLRYARVPKFGKQVVEWEPLIVHRAERLNVAEHIIGVSRHGQRNN